MCSVVKCVKVQCSETQKSVESVRVALWQRAEHWTQGRRYACLLHLSAEQHSAVQCSFEHSGGLPLRCTWCQQSLDCGSGQLIELWDVIDKKIYRPYYCNKLKIPSIQWNFMYKMNKMFQKPSKPFFWNWLSVFTDNHELLFWYSRFGRLMDQAWQ